MRPRLRNPQYRRPAGNCAAQYNAPRSWGWGALRHALRPAPNALRPTPRARFPPTNLPRNLRTRAPVGFIAAPRLAPALHVRPARSALPAQRAPRPSFPRRRESRPQDGAQAPKSPSPYKGRGRRKRGGERVLRSGRKRAPIPVIPPMTVIPAKAGIPPH